jgi:hypothetical protein
MSRSYTSSPPNAPPWRVAGHLSYFYLSSHLLHGLAIEHFLRGILRQNSVFILCVPHPSPCQPHCSSLHFTILTAVGDLCKSLYAVSSSAHLVLLRFTYLAEHFVFRHLYLMFLFSPPSEIAFHARAHTHKTIDTIIVLCLLLFSFQIESY